MVSHDRYFLDRTIENIFKFEDTGKIREFAGNYSAYLETIEREEADMRAETRPQRASAPAVQSPKESEKSKSNKLSFKEKRELETLELQIPETEKRLAEIDRELIQFATDAHRLNELVNQQQKLSHQLEQFVERWAELAESAEL